MDGPEIVGLYNVKSILTDNSISMSNVMKCDTWYMIYDAWDMTHVTWHMTHDTWHMTPYSWRTPFCIFGGTHFVEMGSSFVDSLTRFVVLEQPFVDSVTHFVVLEQPDGKFYNLEWQNLGHRPECWFLNWLETTKLVIFKSRNNKVCHNLI